ncbi:MAG: hypothetical protein ACYC21_06630 [Eubacteriales bacterium]
MPVNAKRPVNPILIPIISAPHFILGGLLTAFNWNRLGFPGKARNTVKWSIIGTIAVIIIAFYIPVDTLKKMWSVGVGINLGTGMALRTLQLPEYQKAMSKLKQVKG